MQDELLFVDGLAQGGFQRKACQNDFLHIGIEKADIVTTDTFGIIHGQVGALEQLVDAQLLS